MELWWSGGEATFLKLQLLKAIQKGRIHVFHVFLPFNMQLFIWIYTMCTGYGYLHFCPVSLLPLNISEEFMTLVKT